MAYSTDLRKRVLDFIETGGKKVSEAARRFSLNRSTIYRWLRAEDPTARQKTGPKKMICLDEVALKKHVADFPDLTQNERASHFGVSVSSIGYGLRKLGISEKKYSDIKSGVMRNVKSTVRRSPRNTPQAKR
ncbi:helix-turn-helix domain-containing protein [Candidatus Poribacteria bacterium]|nr:helix-turn-helix domain-containing protein [Candidatus Poribacteria bacterium]